MPYNILEVINNFFILLGIAIILYGIACVWAVSSEDFVYFFEKTGEFLRKIVDKIKKFLGFKKKP